jgi:transposase InsO family protein
LLCNTASASRSGYYYWNKHKNEACLRDADAVILIKAAHKRFHSKAGIRTIRMYLEFKHGIVMNTKKIARIKKEYRIETKIRRKSKYHALNKAIQEDATAPNILNREFIRDKPDEVYSTDITYLPYYGGRHAFLSAVKDLASKEIVHYKISQSMNMELVHQGLNGLFEKMPMDVRGKLIMHSDQGIHYRNHTFRDTLKRYGVVQSMSRKGNCLDNAPIESFFGHMKDEIDLKSCKSFNEVETMVSKYMLYYNNERRQWTLKKMTPAQYRCHLNS